MPGQLEKLSVAIAESIADLLGTAVAVVDESGVVLASAQPAGPGTQPLGPHSAIHARVNINVGGQRAQVIIGAPQTKEPVPPRVAETLVSLLVKQKASRFEAEGEREAKILLTNRLLIAPTGSETALVREARSMGVDLVRPRSAILVAVGEYPPQGPGPIRGNAPTRIPQQFGLVFSNVHSYFQSAGEALYARPSPSVTVVLKGSSRRDLYDWLESSEHAESGETCSDLLVFERAAAGLFKHLQSDTEAPVSVAFGRFYPGVRGLQRSFNEASLALKIGRHMTGPQRVYSLHTLGVRAFAELASVPTRIAMADQLLGPIDHDEQLVTTLRVFFEENCSLSTSAYRLSLHRNTLTYRLDKIARTTGLDPRRLDDAVQMRTAIVLREARGQLSTGGLAPLGPIDQREDQ